jgi:hypothetical protein
MGGGDVHLLHITLTPSVAATLVGLLFNLVAVVMLRFLSTEEMLDKLEF